MKRFIIILICGLSFIGIAKASIVNAYTNLSADEFFVLPEIENVIKKDSIDFFMIEAGVFHATNQYRSKKKKPFLNYNQDLSTSASIHANQMVKYNFFSHINNKNKTYKRLEDRAQRANYTNYSALAENLYYGFIDVQEGTSYKQAINTITQSFIDSREHNENLLEKDLAEMGCAISFTSIIKDGIWQYYFVQNFGSRF